MPTFSREQKRTQHRAVNFKRGVFAKGAVRKLDLPPHSAGTEAAGLDYDFGRISVHPPQSDSRPTSAGLPTTGTVQKAAERGVSLPGQSLPHLPEIQRWFGRHDLSHVRAHQDSGAATAALAIAARAYTTGDHVAFADTPDLRTSAHEAAHVVQQRAGVRLAGNVGEAGDVYERHADAVADLVVHHRSAEALLDTMAPMRSNAPPVQRQVVQRTPIPTDYGKFDATKFADIGPSGGEYGIDAVLQFDPDRTKVNAKLIGLIQSVRLQLGGTATGHFPIEQTRRVPSGTGEGSQIDRLGKRPYGNPLFATTTAGASDKLGDTPTLPKWGQHGFNYKEGGTLKHQEAILKDDPNLRNRGPNSGQQFETTALAIDGVNPKTGTYMGSVTWGWNVDGAGKFTKQPLKLQSKGNPSAGFVAAAKQWNKTSVGGTIKTIADPTVAYGPTFSPIFNVAKGTEVEVKDGSYIHNNETYDLVVIKSGNAHVGDEAVIKVNDMQETGGTAVIPVPIP